MLNKNRIIKRNHQHRLYTAQRGKCYYCSAPMLLSNEHREGVSPPHNLLTLDHIIPRSKGGAASPTTNCVASCLRCNNERGTKDARLFMLEKQGLA